MSLSGGPEAKVERRDEPRERAPSGSRSGSGRGSGARTPSSVRARPSDAEVDVGHRVGPRERFPRGHGAPT